MSGKACRFESVEAVSHAFEQAWRNADAPLLADYVPPPLHPLSASALVRLVVIDLDWAWRSRHENHLESYLERWPGLRANANSVRELLEAECLSRGVYDSLPSLAELRRRFPEEADSIDLVAVESRAIRLRRDRSFLGSDRFFVLR